MVVKHIFLNFATSPPSPLRLSRLIRHFAFIAYLAPIAFVATSPLRHFAKVA
jgi:hypothetical protein